MDANLVTFAVVLFGLLGVGLWVYKKGTWLVQSARASDCTFGSVSCAVAIWTQDALSELPRIVTLVAQGRRRLCRFWFSLHPSALRAP